MKNKQLKTEQLLNQLFSPEKIKAIKLSALCHLSVEKSNILIECLLPYTYSIVYPNVWEVCFTPLLKQMYFHRS